MNRKHIFAALAGVAVLALIARPARAQDWRPPTRQMPSMPASAEVGGGWAAGQSAWFLPGASDVRAAAEGGGARARFVRFTGGMRPVAAWTDRNGDGRADMVELFRSGAVAVQLLDPDYDGTADVMRVYDGARLVREERL
ncbi:MAG TPA: hypothetical protein VF625_16740 [Longimicrobium sp.]